MQSRIYCTVAELIGNMALLITCTWNTVCDSNEVNWKLHEIFVSIFFDIEFLQYLNQLDFKSFSSLYYFICRLQQRTEC
jgi:hypothetical protein